MIQRLLLIATLSFIFIACGGDGVFTGKEIKFQVMNTDNCTQKGRNQFVYDLLKDSYLWSDKVKDLNVSQLNLTDTEFLDAYLFSAKDKYSFTITRKVYDEHFISGESKDFGYRMANYIDEHNVTKKRIRFVFPGSPADKAGIKRSDIIIKSADSGASLKIKDKNGQSRYVHLKEEGYAVNNVLYQEVYNNGEHKVGYFLFKSFVGPNLIRDLDSVFADFKAQGVSDLILDLRYNSGGLLDVAAHLGSLIGGENVKGHILQYNRYNEKYSQYNNKTYFSAIPRESLNLKRVFILTTDGTVSASESLINGLKASENGMEVVTIGMPTFGKQFGMHPMPYCDRVLFPIQLSDANSDGDGFSDGLQPTCKLQENFADDFMDINESLLSEALFYIQNGHCSR